MKVLICGDRNWTDRQKIADWIREWLFREKTTDKPHILIHGAAKGADTIANLEAHLRGKRIKVKSFPADWNTHGKSAGPIRNRKMLDEKPDLVVAFHSNISKSKGTKDCIEEANRRGIKVEIIP